jgi:protein-S-isoprenylcysteine O-methyltransferase Ste14
VSGFLVQPDRPLVLCLLAWVALGVGMVILRGRGSGAAARRDPKSNLGLAVQALAFAMMFAVHRRAPPTPSLAETAARWAGVLIAWISAAAALRAVHVLGRHWSLEARLLPGHRLVREGPYARVRHPIYAALLGLMLGTGLNLTPWLVLAVAVAVYLAGTELRVQVEEALLRREFGDEYSRYVAEVPALLPRPWPSRGLRRL